MYYDEINQADIIDLRNSSKKVEDYNRLISREFNKLVAGTTRGEECELVMTRINGVYNVSGGWYINMLTDTLNKGLFNNWYFGSTKTNDYGEWFLGRELVVADLTSGGRVKLIAYSATYKNILKIIPLDGQTITSDTVFGFPLKSTRTKSNTLLHCDIIGNPTNYPTAWKESGVFGTPLIVAEDGTSLLPNGTLDTFKLSRKANATPLLCLRSTDSGATWTSFTPTFNTITNEITLINEPASNLVMVYYQTHTSMAVPVVNSEVLEYGKVLGTNGLANAHLVSTLIGKVSTANTSPYLQMGYDINAYRIDTSTIKWSTTATEIPVHSALTLAGGASGIATVKVFPYLTRLNGKAYLNLVFKEMKHNGTSWGDDSKFNIVDNVSTTTDTNAQTVLIGQKTVELPYFIGADE